MSPVVGIIVGLAVGVGLTVFAYWIRLKTAGRALSEEADQIRNAARAEREQLLRTAEIEAKETHLIAQQAHEDEVKTQRETLGGLERRLRQRETNVERKNEMLERRERELRERENHVRSHEHAAEDNLNAAERKLERANAELESAAGLSRDEARKRILAAIEDEARQKAAGHIERIEREAQSEANERANKIVSSAIQRLASGFVSEKTVSVIELPNDDMKGRIIGREGRNIRALEQATGVDVIIDDTPEVVILSAFNPVRREMARMALARLIDDGRIHPARIEEVVGQVTEEMDELIVRHGEQATFDLGIQGLHSELVKLVGQLKYRVVNGQNAWSHAMESASIAGMMAHELGLNAQLAKRAGLLHDIGRAVAHEVQGDHPQIAAEHAQRFGEREEVVAAIRHHHDPQPPTVLGVLVQAADTLSKARPGARSDVIESYIKRLEHLEHTALGFHGVDAAFAIQSGREVRVIVNYEEVSDQEALLLSGDIARRIEETLTYPGEVRVTVIREARATEIAR